MGAVRSTRLAQPNSIQPVDSEPRLLCHAKRPTSRHRGQSVPPAPNIEDKADEHRTAGTRLGSAAPLEVVQQPLLAQPYCAMRGMTQAPRALQPTERAHRLC